MAIQIAGQIIDFLNANPGSSSKSIYDSLQPIASYATIKRALSKLVRDQLVLSRGQGKARTYSVSPSHLLLLDINTEEYFKKEIDERVINGNFNFDLLENILPSIVLFTQTETNHLNELHQQFLNDVRKLTPELKAREMQRLAIDLSWKSSQIEGNTYSLLETERLLTEKETAAGKPKDDAIMLLNHKEAIEFILQHPDYVAPLNIRTIEDIHSILVKDLYVDRNIRMQRVGITGTNYRPLDNAFQIREAMLAMCNAINLRSSVFEKALLCLALISYIQPFNDGNKRTSRIVSNAVLLAQGFCPLSFRTADATDYKKAMLIFYEQNNISAFKKIFMEQYEFAVKTYF